MKDFINMLLRRTIHFIESPEQMLGKLWIELFGAKTTPDKWYLKVQYQGVFGKKLDFKHPITFNEKLQWLKLYDRNPIYSTMVDKIDVKKWVADKLGDEYVIPTLGVYNNFEEIDFNQLPNSFVLKCSHDSGSVIICKQKRDLNMNSVGKSLSDALKRSFYDNFREWSYKNVKHRLFVEQYLDCKDTDLKDYKLFCFNGKVKFFKIDFDRFTNHGANYYNTDLELLPFGEACFPRNPNKQLIIPNTINSMIEKAELIASGIPFIRVDFYDLNGKIYFGECTFFPNAGLGKFEPEEWDYKIGEMLTLPKRK